MCKIEILPGGRNFLPENPRFLGSEEGPERVRPGGWEWVCSRAWRPDLGLAEDATATRQRQRRDVGPRQTAKHPGAEKAAPGPSQGQALLLLDFTMILQYCGFVTTCIRHWPTFAESCTDFLALLHLARPTKVVKGFLGISTSICLPVSEQEVPGLYSHDQRGHKVLEGRISSRFI